MTGCRAGETDRSGTCYVHDGPCCDASGDRTVVSRRKNIGKQREVANLLHCFVFVGKLKQVEVRIRAHNVLGLSADPAAHIDVAVGSAGPRGIYVQADACLPFLAVPAAPTGDIERHGNDVADFQNSTSLPFSMISPVISWPSTSP